MWKTWLTIGLVILPASKGSGHVGDRVVPIFEIPDEMFREINIHDGDIEDWLTVIGEPSLTGIDLIADVSEHHYNFGEEYDPSDLDFRIWLGWHQNSNRIYVAVEGIDDIWIRSNGDERYWDGKVLVQIDGDHSGGIFTHGDNFRENQDFSGGPQGYFPNDDVIDSKSRLQPAACEIGIRETACWFKLSPFADVAGAVYGQNPTIWMTEMYITPFDLLVWDDPDKSMISELRPNKIVGINMRVFDDDELPVQDVDAAFDIVPINYFEENGPDYWADALLVPIGGSDSAVGSVTWGRIKASLQP